MMIESLSASGAAVMNMSGLSRKFLSHTILPVSLSVAITRESIDATEITRLFQSATPRLRSSLS
jgi:hypothetical protein